jgi:Xaa-Pro aminopeptidase
MRRHRKTAPILLAELAFASWQTMASRMSMMALGTCSAAEYQRMITEKLLAAQQSALAAMRPGPRSGTALLAPWHRAASANAKRLGRRKSR